jgi:hypothetical protein
MLLHPRSLSFLVVCVLLSHVSVAQARPDTWVAPDGNNSGDCASTAPCRTFAYAYTQTSVNGSINVASSGSYGPLTIGKAISVVADGVEAAIITGTNGAGIRVQAPDTAIVSLHGLTIDMRGSANDGISFVSGGALHVHRSVIRKARRGINFAPAAGNSEFYIVDTTIADSHGNDEAGIDVRPTGDASIKAVIERVRVEHSDYRGILFNGFGTTGVIAATVSDSVVAGYGQTGIAAFDDVNGGTRLMVERTAAVNGSINGVGVFATGAGVTIWIGNSTVSGNQTGLQAQASAAIRSYATNQVNGNDTDGAPSSTVMMR